MPDATTRCNLGGCLLRVVSGAEGTSHYRLVRPDADEHATRESELKANTVHDWNLKYRPGRDILGAFLEGYNAALADARKLDEEEAQRE